VSCKRASLISSSPTGIHRRRIANLRDVPFGNQPPLASAPLSFSAIDVGMLPSRLIPLRGTNSPGNNKDITYEKYEFSFAESDHSTARRSFTR
jgi:hypothetical protein